MKPLIIIGAPRSGTNLLRDVLCRLPDVTTWPCDEINPIWRYRSLAEPTDQLAPGSATPEVTAYIRKAFRRIARRNRSEVVVEKTCANSLRVAFVHRVVPEACFIFLIRDGRDAVASALRRWQMSRGVKYSLRKARFIPLRSLPSWALRYARERTALGGTRLWGPVYEGMRDDVKTRSLAEVCALQWRNCVELSDHDFRRTSGLTRVRRIRYEDFVENPVEELTAIVEAAEIRASPRQLAEASSDVSGRFVGKWRQAFSETQRAGLAELLDDALARFHYPGFND